MNATLTREQLVNLAEELHAIDFDHPYVIVDGHAIDAPSGIYAPSVYECEQEDGTYDPEIESADWEFVTHGMTGQCGYNGPMMHSSETFGPGMAERLAELAEDYVCFATIYATIIPLEGDSEGDPDSWAVIGLKLREESTCRHCSRRIVLDASGWIDPQATGDDSVWSEVCDGHETVEADHEPVTE